MQKAIQNDVAIYAAHTNLDNAVGGVNFEIAQHLGLQDIAFLETLGRGDQPAGSGLVGNLPQPMDVMDFLQLLKQEFKVENLHFSRGPQQTVQRIAFCGGEAAEHTGFLAYFKEVVKNFRALMKQTKYLNFYANFYAQLAIIAPLILAAPRYFSGAMQLGGLMQTITAFGRVQDALSYFVTVYDTVAQLIAVTHRLLGFTSHLDEVRYFDCYLSKIDNLHHQDLDPKSHFLCH